MSPLTPRDLEKGSSRLESLIFDRVYEVRQSDRGLFICEGENRIIAGSVNSKEGLCLLGRKLYDHLTEVEKDSALASAVTQVRFAVNQRFIEGRDLPTFFYPAFYTIFRERPEWLLFNPYELEALSGEEVKEAIDHLTESAQNLIEGEHIKIKGVDLFREVAEVLGLDGVFTYREREYCTVIPQTHSFRKDLESADAYLMLRQIEA